MAESQRVVFAVAVEEAGGMVVAAPLVLEAE